MRYYLFAFCLSLLFGCQPSKEGETISQSQKVDSTQTQEAVQKSTSSTAPNIQKLGMLSNPGGLLAGTFAPDFTGQDHLGNSVQLSQMLNDGPVILLFYRGQWCPVCNKYMKAMRDSLPALRDAGAQILAITPETADNAKIFLEKTEVDLPVISDTNREIMASYNVLFEVTKSYAQKVKKGLNVDIASHNGSTQAYLPVPATFVIEPSGKIVYVQYSPDYTRRATAAELLAALEKLK